MNKNPLKTSGVQPCEKLWKAGVMNNLEPTLRHILSHIVRHDKWIMSWNEADHLDYIPQLDCLVRAGLLEVKHEEYWKCDSKSFIRWVINAIGEE